MKLRINCSMIKKFFRSKFQYETFTYYAHVSFNDGINKYRVGKVVIDVKEVCKRKIIPE